jgi:2-C-methyl-D-erythritol 4-phosphate cytidylyltransferase
MNNIYAIILSGGIGSRMGSSLPKQFLKLKGLPILAHSVQRFVNWGLCKSLVIVSHPNYIEITEEILSPYLGVNDKIIEGGQTRHESFLNGIKALNLNNDIIFIHDAARPFFTQKELFELVDTTLKWGSASLGVKPTETLVLAEEDKTQQILPREKIYLIKTPQCLHSSLLDILLLEEKEESHPTDLCSWALSKKIFTRIVDSNPYNMKITQKEDLQIAEVLYPLFESWSKQHS